MMFDSKYKTDLKNGGPLPPVLVLAENTANGEIAAHVCLFLISFMGVHKRNEWRKPHC